MHNVYLYPGGDPLQANPETAAADAAAAALPVPQKPGTQTEAAASETAQTTHPHELQGPTRFSQSLLWDLMRSFYERNGVVSALRSP